MTTKLMEAALPLEVSDNALVREKSMCHWRPSTLHLPWARQPLESPETLGLEPPT